MGRFFEGRWIYDSWNLELFYLESHYREEGTPVEAEHKKIIIPADLVPSMVKVLEESGKLPVLMTKTSREDDTKIIHRLIDVIEKNKK